MMMQMICDDDASPHGVIVGHDRDNNSSFAVNAHTIVMMILHTDFLLHTS